MKFSVVTLSRLPSPTCTHLALELPKNSTASRKISCLSVFIISYWFNEVRDCVAINIVDQMTTVLWRSATCGDCGAGRQAVIDF